MDRLKGGRGFVSINSLHLVFHYHFMYSSLPPTILTSHLRLSLLNFSHAPKRLPDALGPFQPPESNIPMFPSLAYEIQVAQSA